MTIKILFIAFSIIAFLLIALGSYTLLIIRRRNRLVELYQQQEIKDRTRLTLYSGLSQQWNVHRPSAALNFNKALILAILSGGAGLVLGNYLQGWLIGIAFALGLFTFAPTLLNDFLIQRRINHVRKHLEGSAEILIGSLKTGAYNFAEAVREAARITPIGPLREELERVYEQITQVKMSPSVAFAEMAERVPCPEVAELRDAVELYETIGGEDALKTLEAVVQNLKKGALAAQEVRHMTQGVRTQAKIIVALILGYIVLLFSLYPDLSSILLTTTTGKACLLISGLFLLSGMYLLQTILKNIDKF